MNEMNSCETTSLNRVQNSSVEALGYIKQGFGSEQGIQA